MEEKTLETLPQQPGVYLMKDSQGAVLYVGKAKNLRTRVKQYFAKNPDSRAMVPFLTAKVKTIDTIVTFSEKEALLLENTLIKKHQPPYNALFKDDKTYLSLVVTTKEKWPMVKLTRRQEEGKVFGPYTSGLAAKETLELIATTFPLRECSNQEFNARKRPCLLYHMKRCLAPCVGLCTKEEYHHVVEQALAFLQGKDKEILKQLKEEMELASETLAFEKAARLLQTIRHIERVIAERNSTVYASQASCDAFAILQKEHFTLITKLLFRDGKLVDRKNYHFSCVASSTADTLSSFLLQHYGEIQDKPDEILLPFPLEYVEELLQIPLSTPQRGDKKHIVDLAMENTKAEFQRQRLQEETKEDLLCEMQELFSLANFPGRIDCFDTSNISQSDPTASMVVFLDGKKENRLSRLYKTEKGDDYTALKEVLTRRYVKAKAESTLPDLIIMDGGRGQLNIAFRILAELDIATVDVIALTKEEARHDKGLTEEKVCLRDREVHIPPHSPLLFFLQTIRDEAHRRAITFHRKRRSKRIIKSLLDEIPGIGPTKRTRLLHYFGSVEKIKQASREELASVPGLSTKDIDSLFLYLHERHN